VGRPVDAGAFTAFTDPAASRDVLNNLDVILSWRRKEVLLLEPITNIM
jgi:hypothetical protein